MNEHLSSNLDYLARTVETLSIKNERLTRERDHATVLVGELAALIPLKETITATRTGATMVQWFKEHLRLAPEMRDIARDAARYRWLRQNIWSGVTVLFGDDQTKDGVGFDYNDEDFDNAVDGLMPKPNDRMESQT